MTRFVKLIFALVCISLSGCTSKNGETMILEKITNQDVINDSLWIKNNEFVYGDIRRYGFLNKNLSKIQLDSIIELAEKGVKIIFPKGVYPINFILQDIKNINIHFNQSIIAGKLSIQNVKDLKISGNIKILDVLFLKDSQNVSFDSINLLTDKTRNLNGKANRGVSIYSGCKKISIKNLRILDCGGNDNFYRYSQASFMIHGFNDTPENIKINKLVIKNSNRTGAYISGKGHEINKIEIINYGLSKSTSNIKPVEKASKGEESVFSGLWINYAESNQIDTLRIRNESGLGDYSVIFDESSGARPNIISAISIKDINPYKVNINSNTLVYSEF